MSDADENETVPGDDQPGEGLMVQVDQAPGAHRATESDEEDVLGQLYGAPDSGGIYRGEFVGGELADENGEPAE